MDPPFFFCRPREGFPFHLVAAATPSSTRVPPCFAPPPSPPPHSVASHWYALCDF